MAGVGDKIRPHALDPLLLSQIAECDEHEPRMGRFAVGRNGAICASNHCVTDPGNVKRTALAALSFRAIVTASKIWAEQLANQQAGLRIAKKIARSIVRESDGHIPVNQDARKRQCFEEGLRCFGDNNRHKMPDAGLSSAPCSRSVALPSRLGPLCP